MRWLIVFVVALVVFNVLGGWLKHLGLGKLPGDFSFRLGGRDIHVPLASSLVLAGLMAVIGLLV
jgi:Protein of unknown function (DUF2905)